MSAKLDAFAQEIAAMQAQGFSVRKIAERLSDLSGQHVASSSIHAWIRSNGNGEVKESRAVDPALVLERLDHVALRLDELEAVRGGSLGAWLGGGAAFGAGLLCGLALNKWFFVFLMGLIAGAVLTGFCADEQWLARARERSKQWIREISGSSAP
ncbi:MAG: hypothetical protein JNL98_02610 [Bryobacterales bacterium]|nr:hypothetical protein [Bryobacterales bacterium]